MIIRFLNLEKVSVLPHPSYFSYLDPCDCFLFPKRKNISGRRYRYQKALCSDIIQCLSSLPNSGYCDAFQIWIHILKLYILNSEEYLKGILMFILLLQTSSFLRRASIEISYSSYTILCLLLAHVILSHQSYKCNINENRDVCTHIHCIIRGKKQKTNKLLIHKVKLLSTAYKNQFKLVYTKIIRWHTITGCGMMCK